MENITKRKVFNTRDSEWQGWPEFIKKIRLELPDLNKFLIFMLDDEKQIIWFFSSATVESHDLYRAAVAQGATAVFVARDDAGNLTPTNEDVENAKRLVEDGEILGIRMMDYRFAGNDVFYSFTDMDGLGNKTWLENN